MTEWQDNVRTSTVYTAKVGEALMLQLTRETGGCAKPDCVKWRVTCMPFILKPVELEVEDSLEDAKFAAIQVLRQRMIQTANLIGEE